MKNEESMQWIGLDKIQINTKFIEEFKKQNWD